MITVVIGGSGSGKSEYAEDLAVGLGQDKLIYIATMQPFDEESKKRIIRHQTMRSGKNFKTIECFTRIDQLRLQEGNGNTVLLECMSNLVANEMFSPFGVKEKTFEAIQKGIMILAKQSKDLILVTNNVFEDGCNYDNETMEYINILGQVNQWISSIADQVFEVIHGIPVPIKKINSILK